MFWREYETARDQAREGWHARATAQAAARAAAAWNARARQGEVML